MNTPLVRFPSIEQFRDIYNDIKWAARHVGWDKEGKEICDPEASLPIVNLYGCVKLHGMNVAVNINADHIWYQSRETVLTEGREYNFLKSRESELLILAAPIIEKEGIDIKTHTVTLYFEFAGEGIQKKTAIQNYEKALYLFAVHYAKTKNLTVYDVNGEIERILVNPTSLMQYSTPENKQIYNIHKFETFYLSLNLNNIENVKST